ncbi:MAG TPA: TonB-dependent receptor [Terriglobia bacterium]|nr:TonB-dependent receptor [Terriglobia bacterium]
MNRHSLRASVAGTIRMVMLFCCAAGAAWAQVESGTITGVVHDSSGAVVPGAHVVITSVATRTVRTTEANATGDFSVPFLAADRYNIEVSKQGFQTYVEHDVPLNVAQTLRRDITLVPGSIQQQVVVTGQAPALQTDDATLGQLINHQEVVNLPLNGRNFMDLASLSAGTSSHEPGARDANNGGFSSNGGRSYDNNVMLDGIDNNNLSPDLRNGTDFIVKPPPDAIAEFKVETSGYGPEFGRGGGAAVNLAIRSGTNQFHGDAWEFLRNNKLDARNFFDYVSNGAPPFKQNQFGATAGGPIVRDRTFFFGDYEGTRIRQSESFLSTVPTAQEKLGNFSDGFLGTIVDPTTGQPYPSQQIPQSQMDPVALKVAQLFPDPNVPGTDQFAYNPLRTNSTNQFDVRVDHQVNQATPIFARVSYSKLDLLNPGTLPGLAIGATNGATTGNTTTTGTVGAALGITHVFSPTLVNDFRFGYARLNENQVELLANVNAVQQLGIPGIPFVSGINGGLPNFGFSDVRQLGSGGCEPTIEITNVFTYRDVLNVVRGAHSMNIGFEGRPSEFTILQPCGSRGEFNYVGLFTGSGFADFLIGMPVNAGLASFHNIDYKHDNYGAFWGDTWRVSSHLSLNLGLRWEYHTPIFEKYNAQASLGFDNIYHVSKPVTLPSTFPFPVRVQGKYLNDPQHNDWAPRLGFAYRLGSKTVVRGAYGIFWQAEEIGTYSNPSPGFNPPYYINAQFNAISATQVNPIVNVLGNGFPANAITAGFDPTGVFYVRLQPDLADAYIQSWNLAVQRELGAATSLEVAYAGNKGTHLINGAVGNQATPSADPNSPIQPRRPIPVLQSETFDVLSNAYSNYNGLAVTLRHRLSRGLSANVAYTWSHALDIQSSSNLGSANNNFFRDYNHQFWEYGNADFDTRHRLTAYYEYQLPFGRGRAFASNTGRALNAVIGGWSTFGIWTYQSGNWFTPLVSFDPSNSGSNNPRPDMICNPNQGAPHTTTTWFNTSCFVLPAEGTFGNTGRNVILGPRFFDTDLSLMKVWSLSEFRKLEFRAEFFNAFNHPTFPQIDDLLADDPHFGLIQNANTPRQIQFALKLYW